MITDVTTTCWTIIDTRHGEPLEFHDLIPHTTTPDTAHEMLSRHPWSTCARWAAVVPDPGPCVAVTCDRCNGIPDGGWHYSTRAVARDIATSEGWHLTTNDHLSCPRCATAGDR